MSQSFLTAPGRLDILQTALACVEAGFTALPPNSPAPTDSAVLEKVLLEVAERLRDNYPYFHPLYAGQMMKPPDPVAHLAYALAMFINPNNHALDGGRASSAMEKEAVGQIADMFGWKEHLGHLCSGGTMANLEALWVSGQLRPGKTILASAQAHYTHGRVSKVLGIPFDAVACDGQGRIDLGSLEARLRKGGVGTLVATIGTTATGSVDPLRPLLELRDRYGFRLHADAAYGGYFTLVDNLRQETGETFTHLCEVDSIVVDPHKHGLQPYGCGCVLFRDPAVGRFYKHDSPYTYFTSTDLHLGEISLECSRPGAAAVALWATLRMFPLARGGEFAKRLARSRTAALDLHARLCSDARFLTAFAPELDIVVWLPRAAKASDASHRSRRLFAEAARRQLHLALAHLPAAWFDPSANGMEADQNTVTCLRSVLMKLEHADWVEPIWEILNASAGAIDG